MSIINELKRIGKSEINFSISYFYDNQWIFKLGDDLNGYTYEASSSSIEKGMNELLYTIIKEYPNSEYTVDLKNRVPSIIHYYKVFKEAG